MNLDRVTAELAYDLVQREVWTVAEFQAWHLFKLKEADNSIETYKEAYGRSETTLDSETDNGIDKYFVEAYEEAFGYFPSLVQGNQVKFFNAVVNLCKRVTLDPMTYDATECGDDVARDIVEELGRLCVKC